MPFHLSANSLNAGAAATLQDVPAVADTVFSTQSSSGNNHFIYTDDIVLIGLAAHGATVTAHEMFSPSLQPYGNFYNPYFGVTAAPGNYPRIMDFKGNPFSMPKFEQIQQQITTSAAGACHAYTWLGGRGWSNRITKGTQRSFLSMTATPTNVARSWSGLSQVTFTNQPRGGWYVIHSIICIDANAVAYAFRVFFPRMPGFDGTGRVMRPGDLCQQAAGNLITPNWSFHLGDWGAFHSFEPMQVETFGNAAGATSLTLYADVDYMGQGDPGGAYPLAA